jgi:hypothetical protein
MKSLSVALIFWWFFSFAERCDAQVIESEVKSIIQATIDNIVKPIVNSHKDDILDSLGLPTSVEEGFDWFNENPVTGTVVGGGLIGVGIIGIESGIINSIPFPTIDLPTIGLPNGGTVGGSITPKIGFDGSYSFGFNFEIIW